MRRAAFLIGALFSGSWGSVMIRDSFPESAASAWAGTVAGLMLFAIPVIAFVVCVRESVRSGAR